MLKDFRVGSTIAVNLLKRGNRKTSFFTILILTLIFINLLFLPSMMYGMTSLFKETVTDFSGNIIIEPSPNEIYLKDVASLMKKINSLNEVTESTKRLNAGATLSYKGKYVGTKILGIDPDKEIEVTRFDKILIDGEFLSRLSRDEIILGKLLAGEEGGPEVYDSLGGIKVGSIINVSYSNGVSRQYRLKGIHEGGSELSDLVSLVHYKEIEDVLGLQDSDLASTVLVKVDHIGDEPAIKSKLLEMGVKEKVVTWQEKVEDLIKSIVDSFALLTSLSKIVSVIIAIFVLFIVIYINTLNRKKQIGILKAVGITPRSIIISYVMISMFYTILGIIAGGILMVLIVSYLTISPIHFYASMYVSPVVQWSLVVQSVVALLISAIISGLIPSWLATRDPILKSIWGK